MEPLTFTIAKVAFMFNVTEVTVLNWIQRGRLKADVIQKGMRKNYKIHEEDIVAFSEKYNVREINK